MEKWKLNENEAFNYLEERYKNKKVSFAHDGGHDSSIADICVKKFGVIDFYIEVKSVDSACGQFVLINQGDRYEWSKQNKSPYNAFAEAIIVEMNDHYECFKEESTKEKIVDISNKLAFEWVKDYYKEHKKVKYIIVPNENKSFLILPIERMDSYFDIKTTFRIKKSGSSNPTASMIKQLKELDFISEPEQEGKHFWVKLNNCGSCNLQEKIDGRDVLFRFDNDKGKHKVTVLSNTRNSNILFYIHLKQFKQDEKDLQQFKNDLLVDE